MFDNMHAKLNAKDQTKENTKHDNLMSANLPALAPNFQKCA